MAEPARAPAPTISERAAVTADPSARDPVPAWSPSASPSQVLPSAPRASGTGESGRRGAAVGGGPGPAGTGRGPGSDEGSGGRGPGGASLVASTGGPGTGSAEYGAYLAQWRRRIHENLRYPLAARRRSLTGTVQLDIVIHPNGVVASVQIAESSSHGLLDEAAMEAVRGLSPLPFPSHLVPRPLRARLPVVFDLQ